MSTSDNRIVPTVQQSVILIDDLANNTVKLEHQGSTLLNVLQGGLTQIIHEGSGGGNYLEFDQASPLFVWTIDHNFNQKPSVTLIIGDFEVEADISYPNNNRVLINFLAATSGTAILLG